MQSELWEAPAEGLIVPAGLQGSGKSRRAQPSADGMQAAFSYRQLQARISPCQSWHVMESMGRPPTNRRQLLTRTGRRRCKSRCSRSLSGCMTRKQAIQLGKSRVPAEWEPRQLNWSDTDQLLRPGRSPQVAGAGTPAAIDLPGKTNTILCVQARLTGLGCLLHTGNKCILESAEDRASSSRLAGGQQAGAGSVPHAPLTSHWGIELSTIVQVHVSAARATGHS